jgi:hypothetical protein
MKIKNECKNLPKRAMQHVERSLKWINPIDLAGIDRVRLVERLPSEIILGLKESKASVIYYNRFLGLYRPMWGNDNAEILLRITEILKGVPAWFMLTPVPTLLIARVLAHEVGHHLVEKQGYVFEPTERKYRKDKSDEYEEEMVDRYAFEVVRKMKTKWYYRFGHGLIEMLSDWHYTNASLDWEKKQYRLAHEGFLKAWYLNPDNEEALKFYWYAKDLSEEEDRNARRKNKPKKS